MLQKLITAVITRSLRQLCEDLQTLQNNKDLFLHSFLYQISLLGNLAVLE